MENIKKILICLTAILTLSAAVSCQKDDTIQYNNSTMGNIVNGTFISDQGNIFNVVDQTCDGKLDTLKRAFVVCDILNKTAGGSSNEYDVRVNYIADVLTKNVVPTAEATDEMKVQDPIRIEYIWLSGGYVNMFVVFPVKEGSKTTHLVNLIHEGMMTDKGSNEEKKGTYRFTLCHNSYGDKLTPPQTQGYLLTGGYVSFPLSSFISENEAEIQIDWVWHKTIGTGLSTELDNKTVSTIFKKNEYTDAPSTSYARIGGIR